MRKSDGSLDGYLVDAWKLWEAKTGVRVTLVAKDWAAALETMRAGNADVIDTIVETPQRLKTLDFSKSYASIPFNIYTRSEVTGITGIADLQGFVVGVKSGDACIDKLLAHDETEVREYRSYDAMLSASLANHLQAFCMDEAPANFLIIRSNALERFRKAFTIDKFEFRRAVRKGNVATLDLVNQGFESLTDSEIATLRGKWFGEGLSDPVHQNLIQGLQLAAAIILALIVVTLILRAVVKRRTADLANSERHLQAILDAMPDLLFELDLDGRYLDYHSPRTDLLAAPAGALLGKTVSEILPPDAANTCLLALKNANSEGYSNGQEIELVLGDQSHWFELSISRKHGGKEDKPTFIVLSRDITQRKTNELRILRLSQLYAALSQCNQSIVRCQNQENLFSEICQNVVSHAGLKMAWIGMLDDTREFIVPIVSSGAGQKYLNGIEIAINFDESTGRGPTGTAMREERPVWCQDFQHDPSTAPWHERAARFGWGSSAALPLKRNGEVVGVISLYDQKINAFDEETQALLLELSADVSYALDKFSLESENAHVLAALRESEEAYRATFNQAAVGIARVAPDGAWLEVNQKLAEIVGYSTEELLQMTFQDLTHPDDLDRDLALATDLLAGKIDSYQMEKRYRRKTGELIWIYLTVALVRDSIGAPRYFISVVEDIDQRKQDAEQIHKLSTAVEQSPNSIVITGLDANIEYVNENFVKLTGYARDEVIGRNPRILKSGKTAKETYEDLWAHLIRGEIWKGELINRRKDGSTYIELATISPIRSLDGRITNYLAIKENVTGAKEAERKIESLAHFDQLTGLPNRALLSERFRYLLNLSQRSGEQFTVMFLDLDHFKDINDSLGHTTGDKLLLTVADRIKGALREEDTVSRLGGDEFILLLHKTDSVGASHVANKLMAAVSEPCQIEQYELISTPSIGIAIYPDDGTDLETLSRNADAAMYQVKQSGRNAFRFFTPEMQAHSARSLQLANALRHALSRNEMFLHYQPQISLQDGHVVGAEALLRWQHPEFGYVSPAEFISIAENSGQIIPIGEWVIRSAVRQLKRWMDNGMPAMVMAVNLSSVQFRQSNIVDVIKGILDEERVSPEYLELELTEAVAMGDPMGAIDVMNKLHAHGIRMSIDDFGTGYSSLSYLKKFKVYKLKIDQSFVRDITDDPDDKAIVAAIVNMASSLGIQTIAEGVETAGQLSYLRLQGCSEAQGYYFSKPVSADAFSAYVSDRDS